MHFGCLQHRPSTRTRSQSGYMLIVLIFLVVGITIAALSMAPAVATQIKRDRETEMIHRGVEYARAVKRYYKKFGRYPPTLEALEDTNHIRFLRKRYKDPLTQDGKWQLVRFGQVQMNAAGRQGGGAGLTGGTGLPNVPGVTGLLTGQNPQQSTFGSQMGSTMPGGAGSTTGTPGAPGSTANTGTTGDTTGSSGSSFGNSFGQSTTAGGNQQFGGGAIIGVSSMSDKESLRVVDDKNHYKDWKFIYDPTFDRGPLINGPYDAKKQMGQFGAQQPGQQIGTPAGQQSPSGFSNNPGGSTFGQPTPTNNPSPAPQPYQPPDQNAPPPGPQ